MKKHDFLKKMLSDGSIRINAGGVFGQRPSSFTHTRISDRAEGMLLGLAIGDSLGNTSEAMMPDRRAERHGVIRDYLPHPWAEKRTVGLPSDDTQLAFWTLQDILEHGAFNPDSVARRFATGNIFGIGQSVREFRYNYISGKEWFEAGPRSAGNGALMRIAPILIPHLKTANEDLWVDTALCALITHNDSSSISSCVAFVKLLWELIGMEESPSPRWWLESFVETLGQLETDSGYSPRFGEFMNFKGSLGAFTAERVSDAFAKNLSTVDACNSWGSGAYLLETVPSVIYILMKHGHDPEEAIVRAVNDTRDNDTIAAIVGAAVGALHGKSSLPARWIDNHLGRTADSDDGEIFRCLERVKQMIG